MSNFYADNSDMQFYVDQWIDWDSLARLNEFDFRAPGSFDGTDDALEFYRDILELVGGFVAEEVAPHSALIDAKGLTFQDGTVSFPAELETIFKKIKRLELHGMCVPRELGGMNCPMLVYLLQTEIFSRGDVSVAAHHGFHGGMAMAMLAFSVKEGSTSFDAEELSITACRFSEEIAEIVQGNAWGSMDITEPQAGSDMAALRAKGVQDEAGNWFVTGQKIFITSGHGKYHFVIARTEEVADASDPMAGLKGLSFFLVASEGVDASGKHVQHVNFGGIEKKMGHHASATVVVNFDASPALLIGDRGEGFKHMLLLMNNARVGVGFECIGLCEAALRMATEYAEERVSMGKTLDRHEMIADYLDEMKHDILGLRAMAVHGAFEEEMASKKEMAMRWFPSGQSRDLETEIQAHKRRARRVTPLLKYLAAEKAVEIARRNVQIHGGVGYTKEFGAEKLLRDAVVMPIYEGTSQIQALMAMKDTLGGIMKDPRDFVRRLAQAKWRSLSARDPLERRVARLQAVSLGVQKGLMQRTATAKLRQLKSVPLSAWSSALFKDWDPKRDFAHAKLHADRLIRILADEMIAELLLEQVSRFPERADYLHAHLQRAEPRVRFLADEIQTTGERILTLLETQASTQRAS